MGVVVFDADVLVAYLSAGDSHHAEAVVRLRNALEAGTKRWISAVNYAELLVGPLAAGGPTGASVVDAAFLRLGIETKQVDIEVARRAAGVRVRTNLKLPDAFAVATALEAEKSGYEVRLESFDRKVVKAYADLHPLPADLW
jgi:predicted nucleic acid-binding protein